MSEWRPIETAPEDEWVWVYDPVKAHGALGIGQFPVKRIDGVWYEHEHGDALLNIRYQSTLRATHWRPLAEPPEEQ